MCSMLICAHPLKPSPENPHWQSEIFPEMFGQFSPGNEFEISTCDIKPGGDFIIDVFNPQDTEKTHDIVLAPDLSGDWWNVQAGYSIENKTSRNLTAQYLADLMIRMLPLVKPGGVLLCSKFISTNAETVVFMLVRKHKLNASVVSYKLNGSDFKYAAIHVPRLIN